MSAAAVASQLCTPKYWRELLVDDVKTIFITGCGGGFDFVHSGTVIPALLAAGKEVIIGSYSFGDPMKIRDAQVVWRGCSDPAVTTNPLEAVAPVAVRVTASCIADRNYGPEVGMCEFLDAEYPRLDGELWAVYAYYARDFTVATLINLYRWICNQHHVDGVLLIDGGSDSLMKGDEAGLGDPIEDAVSIAAVRCLDWTARQLAEAAIPQVLTSTSSAAPLTLDGGAELLRPLRVRALIAIGVGCDRFNQVSDAATLRAVAELGAMYDEERDTHGFFGSMALERGSALMRCYTKLVAHLESRAFFRSVIANAICAAAEGHYGSQVVPAQLKRRVAPGQLHLWPFMAYHFAFDVQLMFERALLAPQLLKCGTVGGMYLVLREMRAALEARCSLRQPEELPAAARH